MGEDAEGNNHVREVVFACLGVLLIVVACIIIAFIALWLHSRGGLM